MHLDIFLFLFNEIFKIAFFRNRIKPMPAPGVTPGNPINPKSKTPDYPMHFYCLYRILGTARCIATGIWEQRRDWHLVKFYQQDKKSTNKPCNATGYWILEKKNIYFILVHFLQLLQIPKIKNWFSSFVNPSGSL